MFGTLNFQDTFVLNNFNPTGSPFLDALAIPGMSMKTLAAAGTPFAGGPSTLADNGAGNMAALGSPLPPGVSAIYTAAAGTTVALFPFGAGHVVYLGWDWNNAQPIGPLDGGWLTVLNEAVFATARPPVIVTGAGLGGGPHVKVFHGTDASLLAQFFAYDPSFTGGVRVAVGDVNGDGVLDIITGAGPGGGPHVKVFDGMTLAPIASFLAYPAGFTGGVYVAAGDVNGDGKADIITGAGPGGGPHVKVFSGADGSLLASFFAYDPSFTGGVAVAAVDLNSDGKADIVTGAGPGGGPHVKVFNGMTLAPLESFFAYTPTFIGGVYMGAQ